MAQGARVKDEIITRVEHDGRVMLQSVRWWLVEGRESASKLFCIHNIALDKYCQACAEKDD